MYTLKFSTNEKNNCINCRKRIKLNIVYYKKFTNGKIKISIELYIEQFI